MPRVIHFEIHATEPGPMIEFYSSMFAWQFEKWGEMPYWMVRTGESPAPGIDGGMVLRRGAPPTEGQAVNAFVCTVDVADLDASVAKATSGGGTIAVPRMPIPGVGWLAYVKDPEGNILGLMQTDESAA